MDHVVDLVDVDLAGAVPGYRLLDPLRELRLVVRAYALTRRSPLVASRTERRLGDEREPRTAKVVVKRERRSYPVPSHDLEAHEVDE